MLMLLLLACSCMMLHAAAEGTHVNRDLRRENVPVEQATQMFGKWMKTSSDVTFVLVNDETDDLGFRHQTYEQLMNGIRVDAGRLMVHSKDGKITYVNGYVMEADAAPRKMMKARTKNGPKGDVVLVEADGEFRYAVKSFDETAHEFVYTDVETGRVLKRLSTINHAHAPKGQTTISSKSYYYGTQQIDVTQTDNSRYMMADSTRNIFTLDAAHSGVFPNDLNLKDSLTVKNYFDKELTITQTKRNEFSMQEMVSVTLTLTDEAKEKLKSDELKLMVVNGDITVYVDKDLAVSDFPFVYNPLEHKTLNNFAYPLRLNDTDTTLVVLYDIYTSLLTVMENAIDIVRICPTREGGDAEVTARGKNGCLVANATMKGIGHYGVDVHWGLQRTYDFYKTKLNYNSYNNAGSPIIGVINPDKGEKKNQLITLSEPNAYAVNSPQPYLVFGRGAKKVGEDEQGDISTVGHEFTHLVTGKTAKLEGHGESGALNEGFSDIFGVAVTKYVVDNYLTDRKGDIEYIYSIGGDCSKESKYGMERAIFDPWRCQHPKAYKGKYWINTLDEENDAGGTHINCNVLTFWFFLLAEGYAPNGKYQLDTSVIDEQWAKTTSWGGIGIDKAAQIAFRMLTRYMFEKASFKDAYKQSLVAAQDLGYDENSTEYKTLQMCWKAVAPVSYLEGTLDNAFTLELTEVNTYRTYAPNSTRLVPYTGTDLRAGDVVFKAVATINDADKIRKYYQEGQNLEQVKCTLVHDFTKQKYVLDYSDFMKGVIKKCCDDTTIADGYQEDCTMELNLPTSGTMQVTLESPYLPIFGLFNITLKDDARTYEAPEGLHEGEDEEEGEMEYSFIACSGYPMKKLTDDGMTMNCKLYRINEDKSETEIDSKSLSYSQAEIMHCESMEASGYKRYEEELSYTNAALSKPGTYKLKVSFTWDDLNDAEFVFTVSGSTAIDEINAPTPAHDSMTYDLQGRVVKAPRKGVYIRGGRKIVVR